MSCVLLCHMLCHHVCYCVKCYVMCVTVSHVISLCVLLCHMLCHVCYCVTCYVIMCVTVSITYYMYRHDCSGKKDLGELTWEQREHVLRLLFSKMNTIDSKVL